jgi:phospholipase D-like protein
MPVAAQQHDAVVSWIVIGLGAAAVLAFVVLFLYALVSILASGLSAGKKLGWMILAFCAPIVGSLLWFLVGRRDARRPVR